MKLEVRRFLRVSEISAAHFWSSSSSSKYALTVFEEIFTLEKYLWLSSIVVIFKLRIPATAEAPPMTSAILVFGSSCTV
jgi:hypothetical protein